MTSPLQDNQLALIIILFPLGGFTNTSSLVQVDQTAAPDCRAPFQKVQPERNNRHGRRSKDNFGSNFSLPSFPVWGKVLIFYGARKNGIEKAPWRGLGYTRV
jgi:hypothetical protein